MKVFVCVREVVERILTVDVPKAEDWDEAAEMAEVAVRLFRSEDSEFYRLIPGMNVDDQSPWSFSELGYPDESIAVEAYDAADDDADKIDIVVT